MEERTLFQAVLPENNFSGKKEKKTMPAVGRGHSRGPLGPPRHAARSGPECSAFSREQQGNRCHLLGAATSEVAGAAAGSWAPPAALGAALLLQGRRGLAARAAAACCEHHGHPEVQDSCPTGALRGRASSLASERGPCAGTSFCQELQQRSSHPSQLQGPPLALCWVLLRERQTSRSPVGARRGSRAVPQGGHVAGCSTAPSSAPSQQEPQDPAASCSACSHAVPSLAMPGGQRGGAEPHVSTLCIPISAMRQPWQPPFHSPPCCCAAFAISFARCLSSADFCST